MKTYKSESNIRPDELQIEKSFVYVNYNVEKVEVKDPVSEEVSIKYVYDVDEYTKDEYILMVSKQNSDTIDDILCVIYKERREYHR